MKIENNFTRNSKFSNNRILFPHEKVHCLNVLLLKRYLTLGNRIQHPFFSKLRRRSQASVSKAIKQARQLGLLAFKH